MAEKLASLHKKGGGGMGNVLFSTCLLANGGTSWTQYSMASTVSDISGSSIANALEPSFGHLDNGGIVVDRAISKAYISGQAVYMRNAAGTMIYTGLRVLKNGTVITGASVMGSSSVGAAPSFRRIETSFAVGDVITIEYKFSSQTGTSCNIGPVNIVTD